MRGDHPKIKESYKELADTIHEYIKLVEGIELEMIGKKRVFYKEDERMY